MEMQLTPTLRAEKAESQLDAFRRKYKSMQSGAEEATARMTGALVTVGGGVFAGVIWSKFGNGTPGSAKIGETSLEIDTLLAAMMVAAATFGMAGKHSAELGTFGGGMLAARAAAYIGRVMEEHEVEAAKKKAA